VTDGDLREYKAQARSTDTFGRVLCSAREHHVVIDGPVWNGCPGEELTPGEAFMASIAACGVELVEVLAAEDELPVGAVAVSIHGVVDRDAPVREDVTVFNSASMGYEIAGLTEGQAAEVVERVKRRCPLFGSLAASTPEVRVDVHVT
jgi:FXSXX-COOH protein